MVDNSSGLPSNLPLKQPREEIVVTVCNAVLRNAGGINLCWLSLLALYAPS